MNASDFSSVNKTIINKTFFHPISVSCTHGSCFIKIGMKNKKAQPDTILNPRLADHLKGRGLSLGQEQ